MKRSSILFYSVINYAFGVAALVCLIVFLFNFYPPVAIDLGTAGHPVVAVAVNLALIALFGLQHSVMARPRFKAGLTRVIPAPAERSTFMLATAVVVLSLCLLWRPLPAVIWQAESAVVYNALLLTGLSGWALVLYATFLINHFDLFGLRQAWLYFTGQAYTPVPFKTAALYRYVRHPIMTGVFIGIWVTPMMTVGHLLFAIGMSVYIFIGVYHEEKDLVDSIGRQYLDYMRSTARFIPGYRRARDTRESNLGRGEAGA